MVLKSSLLLFFVLSSSIVFAKNSKLPELKTKSDIKTIRFITKDGKYTYYQRRSGALLLSTNYKVKEILTGDIGTHYTIHSSSANKVLVITQNQNFHTYLGLRNLKKIHVTRIGSEEVTQIAEGHSPRLHLDDTWLSYFNPYQKSVTFINLKSPSLTFKVSIRNELNAYFQPDVVMLDDQHVLFTDINNKGIPGVLEYSRKSKTIKAIFKSASSSQRIELCRNSDNLFVGEFGFNGSPRGSIIAKVGLKNFNIDKADIIHQSRFNDFGNIKCDFKKGMLYFIKNVSKVGGRVESEVVALNHVTKSSKVISDLKYVSQLIHMDDRLLIPFRGAFYVLEGGTDLTKVGLLEKEATNNDEKMPLQEEKTAPQEKKENKEK